VYIIYSNQLDKYYVGYTSKIIHERIRKHNTNHKGFTGGNGDWKIMFTELFSAKSDALKREKQIKAWKSRKMIEKLIADSVHPD
jgi:putative endonuclease